MTYGHFEHLQKMYTRGKEIIVLIKKVGYFSNKINNIEEAITTVV